MGDTKFSFASKAVAPRTFFVDILKGASPWNQLIKERGTFTVGTAWGTYLHSFATPAQTASLIGRTYFFLGDFGTASFSTYFDDVSFKATPTSTNALPIQANSSGTSAAYFSSQSGK